MTARMPTSMPPETPTAPMPTPPATVMVRLAFAAVMLTDWAGPAGAVMLILVRASSVLSTKAFVVTLRMVAVTLTPTPTKPPPIETARPKTSCVERACTATPAKPGRSPKAPKPELSKAPFRMPPSTGAFASASIVLPAATKAWVSFVTTVTPTPIPTPTKPPATPPATTMIEVSSAASTTTLPPAWTVPRAMLA